MLPELVNATDNLTVINTFLGLNRTNTVSEGEFTNTRNVTNDYFPVLGNRKRRGILTNGLMDCKAMLGGEVISYVAKEDDVYKLFYNEKSVCEVEGVDNTTLVMMGAYLCVFPDGVIYNTANGQIETVSNKVSTSGTVTFTNSNAEGLNYEGMIKSDKAPSSPADGTYWYDTSDAANPVIKVYSASYNMWQSVATAFTKIAATGIGVGFNTYDAVSINGLEDDTGANTKQSNAHYIIYSAADDFIVIAGQLKESIAKGSQKQELTIERAMPEIDYVCELDNRLWACNKYSHEIYASKLGDPKNWYCYAGLVSDSYAVTVGTQGEFTGCTSYNGSVYFFKESGYHKIMGSRPSNFEVIFKTTRGVQLGSHRSIAHVGEYLFYKAKDAIVLFDGSTNVVSEKLGTEKLFDAVGSGYKDKYYVCMRDSEYNYYMFVYDTTKRTWVIEDDIRVSFMAETNKNGLYICKFPVDGKSEVWSVNDERLYVTIFPRKVYGDNTIYSTIEESLRNFLAENDGVDDGRNLIAEAAEKYGYTEAEMEKFIASRCFYPSSEDSQYKWYPGFVRRDTSMEDAIEWGFETGDIGLASPFNKYIKKIILRLMMDYMSSMTVEVMYDDCDSWEILAEYHCTKKRSIELPLAVKRCDHLRLRFSGHGNFKLYSMAKATEEGSGL